MSTSSNRREVAFILDNLPAWQTLAEGLPAGVEVVVLNASADALTQMADWASNHQGYDAMHLFSHGTPAGLHLGDTSVTDASLQDPQVQALLSQIGAALAPDGDLLLYGCNVAAGDSGQQFVGRLTQLTGADVAASIDLTGAQQLGGNWQLESSGAQVGTAALQVARYDQLLAATNYTEGGIGAAVFSTLTLSHPGGAQIAAATVSIGSVVAGDVLGYANLHGIAGTYVAATGVLTLSGNATLSQYQDALRSVTFYSTSDDPTLGGARTSRAINWAVTDTNGAQSSSAAAVETFLTGSPYTLSANGSTPYVISTDLGNEWTFEADYLIASNPNGATGTVFSYGSYTDGILLRSWRGDGFFVKNGSTSDTNLFGSTTTGGTYVPVKITSTGDGTTGTVRVYVNNVLMETGPFTGPLSPADKTIRIGSAHHSFGEGLDGSVTNIRITKGATTAGSQVDVSATNDAPTLTTISTLSGAIQHALKTITFADLQTAGNEADVDGTVTAFVVKAVSTGTLKIGTSAATATAWAAGSNDTVDAATSAYWTSTASGTLSAFTAVAKDNAGLTSSTAIQTSINVSSAAPNSAPQILTGAGDKIELTTSNPNPTLRLSIPATGVVAGDTARLTYLGVAQAGKAITAADLANGYVDVALSTPLTLQDSTGSLDSVPVKWIDWTSTATSGSNYTVRGTFTTPNGPVNATLTNSVPYAFVSTNGGTNYFNPTTPYVSQGVAAPTSADIIAFNAAGNRSLSFSEPVTNLYFAYVSLNGNGYRFDQDFDIVSQGRGYWGTGGMQKVTNIINGVTYYELNTTGGEPHGVIRFNGTFSTVAWSTVVNENWNGFTLGIKSSQNDLQNIKGEFLHGTSVVATTPTTLVTYDPTLPVSVGPLDTSVSAARLTETNAALNATGSLTLFDADTANVVTAAVASVVVSGATGLTLGNAAVKALLTVASTDTGALQVAKINWTFNSATETFNWLASGEELVLTYQISANDNAGGTDTSTVVITIVGTNDAPVVTPAVVSGTVVAGAPVNGSVSFTDVDQGDTATVRILNDSAVWSGGALSAAQKTALYAGFTINQSTFASNSGAINWTYTTPSGATSFLRTGETATLKEYIEVRDASNKAVSQLVTVVIQADNVAPVVTSVGVPANGTYKSAQNLDFTVNFNEAVTVTGLPRIALTVGAGTLYASYLSGTGSTALVFRLTVQMGNLDTDGITVGMLTLNGGTIKDASGNAATLTLTGTSTTAVLVDAVAPAAPSQPDLVAGSDLGSSNADNLTSATTPTFSGTAEASSTVRLYDTDGTTVLGNTTADGAGAWTITSSALGAGAHSLTAKATDVAGNSGGAGTALVINVDSTAPVPFSFTPVNNTKVLPSSDLVLTFSEPIAKGTGNIRLVNDTAATSTIIAVSSGEVIVSGRTLTLNPLANLISGNQYHLEFDTGAVIDSAGNAWAGISSPTGWHFLAGSPAIVIDAIAADNVVNGAENASPMAISGTVTSDPAGAVAHFLATDFTVALVPRGGGASVTGIVSSYDTATGVWSGSIAPNALVDAKTYDVAVSLLGTSGAAFGLTTSTSAILITDLSAPTAPGTPDLAAAADSGSSATDNITSATTSTVTGTTEANGTVALYDTDGTSLLGTSQADSAGNWSITTSGVLSQGPHTLTAKATDTAGNTSVASSGLIVTIDTVAPTAIALSAATVADAATGTNSILASLSASDTHAITYALAGGAGDGNNASFTLLGTTLRSSKALTTGNYELRVSATDAAGNVSYQPFTFAVTNTAPTITSSGTATVAENEPAGTLIYTAAATEVDTSQAVTYSLGGADAASFAIDANTGELTLLAPANFEAKANYSLNVLATDNGVGNLSSTKALVVTVTDVNESPTITTATTATVAENTAASSVVYTVTASDVDSSQTLTYSLGGADAASFNIAAATGVVTLKAAANFEAKNSYALDVLATDSAGLPSSVSVQAVTLTVTDVNDAPSISSGNTASVAEGAPISTVVYTATASDEDTGQTLLFSLGGADAAKFNIDATTGVVTLKASANFQAQSSYSLIAMATDNGAVRLSDTRALTVSVTPTVMGSAPTPTPAPAPAPAPSGSVITTDASGNTTVSNDGTTIAAVAAPASGSTVTSTGSGNTAVTAPGSTVTLNNTGTGTMSTSGIQGDTSLNITGTGAQVIDLSGVGPGMVVNINHQGSGTLDIRNLPDGVIVNIVGSGPLLLKDADGTLQDAENGAPPLAGALLGDGNGDGLADALQSNVTSAPFLLTPTAQSNAGNAPPVFVTLVADARDGRIDTADNNSATLNNVKQLDAPAGLPAGVTMPLGLISFEAVVGVSGSAGVGVTETFSLFVDATVAINGYWKMDASGTWVNLASVVYGGAVVTEGGKTRLDFKITDGGQFDADNTVNGTIVDPGAAGYVPLSLVGYSPGLPAALFWL